MKASDHLARAALLALALAAPAWAQPQPAPGPAPAGEEAKLVFTFQRASVQAFLGYLSREGGFTFIEEAAVQGDITAVAEKPLTRSQALDVLRAWLLPKGRTLLRTGDVVRIVTLEDAKRRGPPVRVGADPESINDNEEIVTQVMPLRYVQATDVKQQLEGLLSEQGTLMIEGTSNSLVVSDTSTSIRRFAQVLAALDQAVSNELEVKVYRLQNGDADEVSKVISELFSGDGTASRASSTRAGRGGRGGAAGGGGFREMARMFFAGRGGGPGGPGGAPGGGGEGGRGAGANPVLVSTDLRTNAVVVTAARDQLKLIDRLVEELDRDPDPVVTEIRPFPLTNADASSLAQTLTALFQEEQQGRAQTENMPPFIRRMMGNQGEDDSGGEGGSSRYAAKPKFTVDQRTNTLIVSAMPSELEMITSLVKRLDEDPTEATAVLVVPLRHASAENVAGILTDALSGGSSAQTAGGGANQQNQQRQRRQQQLQQAAGQVAAPQVAGAAGGSVSLGGLVGEVSVVADADANTLVFTSSERNFDRLRNIVRQLDQARREVFIECLVAEIQLTDKGELGIQWNAAFTNSLENAEEGSQTLGTDWGLDALADGLRYTTTSNKIAGLLRALKTEGRLNILSSPKILCLENQDAEISVGQEVPFVTNSRITQNGDTVNTIQYRDVGIILRVSPQVNEDGYVRMTVHPEVSSIAPASESVPISEGVRSPTFNRNFADTSIVVRTGETAVIGGLIRDSLSESRFKIPLLGDIPILGHLFGSTSMEKVKQEIVVFLTPHVVRDAGELRGRSAKTIEEFAMVPDEVVRDELDRWLRGLEEEGHAYHYNRGTVLLEGGRISDAIEALRQASQLKGGDAATRFNLALALTRAGRYEEAKAELRLVGALEPRDPEVPYNLGAIQWREGDVPRAAASFQRALQLDPEHEQARAWMARALAEIKRLEAELLSTERGEAPPQKKETE